MVEGQRLNPPPPRIGKRGRPKLGPAAALLARLDRHRDDVLRFTSDFRVPFDNNQAERDVRMVKLQQKISGGWRSESGAQAFLAVRSHLSTARKNGQHALVVLRDLFAGPALDRAEYTRHVLDDVVVNGHQGGQHQRVDQLVRRRGHRAQGHGRQLLAAAAQQRPQQLPVRLHRRIHPAGPPSRLAPGSRPSQPHPSAATRVEEGGQWRSKAGRDKWLSTASGSTAAPAGTPTLSCPSIPRARAGRRASAGSRRLRPSARAVVRAQSGRTRWRPPSPMASGRAVRERPRCHLGSARPGVVTGPASGVGPPDRLAVGLRQPVPVSRHLIRPAAAYRSVPIRAIEYCRR